MSKKIRINDGTVFEYDKHFFGKWINNLDNLKKVYLSSTPFNHIIIDEFLKEDLAKELFKSIPEINNDWHIYNNPIEYKYTYDKIENCASIVRKYIDMINSNEFISLISELTSINNLECDQFLHGSGIHYYPRNGKLDVHLDYSIHPISGKERRLNLILYLNPKWNNNWNGGLELWNKNISKPEQIIMPEFNRAIIFSTSDYSFHGVSKPLKCPSNMGRYSIAMYYMSEASKNVKNRSKANYVAKLDEVDNEKLNSLRKIRNTRRITHNDLKNIYPEWKPFVSQD